MNPTNTATRWHRLCAVADLPADERGKYALVGNRALAIFRLPDGTIRVINDACPHAGGSLSAGFADKTGCAVCPWHGWSFDTRTGTCPDNQRITVRTYPTRIVEDAVEVQM